MLGELVPVGREGDGGEGHVGEAGGEFFAGGGVGVHDFGVEDELGVGVGVVVG